VSTSEALLLAQGSSASIERSVLPLSTARRLPGAAIALSGYASLGM
jgi:hypothetical protein